MTAPFAFDSIQLKGARVHNLKNLSVTIPRDQLTVITGLSGSGKSSLAFDTIYAEGQRRYIESMSLHARQFLEQLEKPDVDSIEGLSPAISIEQKTSSRSSKSTVGTVTETYDYFRLLFSRIGTPKCPVHHVPIERQSVEQILGFFDAFPPSTRVFIYGIIAHGDKGSFEKEFEALRKKGFSRIRIDGAEQTLQQVSRLDKNLQHDIEVAIDRLKNDPAHRTRLKDALQSASTIGKGRLLVLLDQGKETPHSHVFNTKAACPVCFFSFPPLSPRLFSFNSPYGRCPECDGLGSLPFFDPELFLPSFSESLWDFLGEITDHLPHDLDRDARSLFKKRQIALNLPLDQYSAAFRAEVETLLLRHFEKWYQKASSDEQGLLDAFRTSKPCSLCEGDRLCKEARSVTVNDLTIGQLTQKTIKDLIPFLESWKFRGQAEIIADKIMKETLNRLRFLIDVGVGYLTLDRSTASLSGGEAQRVRLASQLGTNLSGVLYVLDEPSIGLHPQDHRKLLSALRTLRDQGNTVLVVEHDEETISAADYVIDIGPGAGRLGGELMFSGTPGELKKSATLTGKFFRGELSAVTYKKRHVGKDHPTVQLQGATGHNLKNITVKIPHGVFVGFTGVSGSGKSSFVMETLFPALKSVTTKRPAYSLPFQSISGVSPIGKVMAIDQKPIGRTPRSNPATYSGVFSLIRQFYARVPDAITRGYSLSRFSFNVKGGRCEACGGDGAVRLEMLFLPDVFIPCDTCGKRRYNKDTLDILYRGKSIADVLEMTIEEAAVFFENHPQIKQKLVTLIDVGLGYLTLGQGSPSLSGGEAQRLKLARELSKYSRQPTLYILDEPTTGLHFEDVKKLLECLQRLVDAGHTVVVIEHHMDVIASCDWIVDMGPGAADQGGEVIYCGPLDQFSKVRERSATSRIFSLTSKQA